MNQDGIAERLGGIDWLSFQADRIARGLIAMMMAVMIAVVLFGVFNRFLFKFPISWTEEIAKYLLVWISMLGSSVAIRVGAHVGVGLLVTRLGKRSKTVVCWINQILIMIFIIGLGILGLKFSIEEMDQMGYVTRISMFWPFLAMPVGSLLMIVQLLHIMKLLHNRQSPPLGF